MIALGGACMVAPGGHASLLQGGGGGHAWLLGGACVGYDNTQRHGQ